MAGLGDQVLRGPVVRIGVDPGPGGLRLAGYRGLDARHAVITAYDGGSATIAPVGSNQIRLAPHANVNWKEIDPVSSPQYLNNGGCIHMGPVGRGATIEFVKCQKLGVWTKGGLASEAENVSANQIKPGMASSGGNVPAAYKAGGSRVGVISTQTAPFWFMGCVFLMASFAISVSLILVVALRYRHIEQLGPVEDGEYFYSYAKVDKQELVEFGLLDGLEQPFAAFVIQPNIEAAGGSRNTLNKRENWDEEFYEHVAASVMNHIKARNFFRRLDQVKDDYSTVVLALRQAGLPEVFAGIPYRESRYDPSMQSAVCAKGWWQFMPEVAYRLQSQEHMDFVVRDCAFSDGGVWSPTEVVPPPNVLKNGKYMSAAGTCRITKCGVDDRVDLEKATAAAMFTLKEAYDDPDLRDSGAVVQMTIASHNGGYADGRFGKQKSSNVKPAYKGWQKGKPEAEWSNFYGDNITCDEGVVGYCGSSPLHSETQHYVYPIVAEHILAVCYYGKNYPDMPAFSSWEKFASGDGYCGQFNIPTPQEIGR
jgi:hypothetical protein